MRYVVSWWYGTKKWQCDMHWRLGRRAWGCWLVGMSIGFVIYIRVLFIDVTLPIGGEGIQLANHVVKQPSAMSKPCVTPMFLCNDIIGSLRTLPQVHSISDHQIRRSSHSAISYQKKLELLSSMLWDSFWSKRLAKDIFHGCGNNFFARAYNSKTPVQSLNGKSCIV